MSALLYDLKANRLMNKTFFTHHLKVYDHSMVLERRRLPFRKEEVTVSYSHVSQVNLIKDLFFAHLEIINTGGFENILIRYVGKRKGSEAKKIIDAKIHSTHGAYAPYGGQGGSADARPAGTEQVFDTKTLVRYKDLLNQGRISKKEYSDLLQKHLKG
ncbi:hypothetical protein COT50_03180 [candidate division WWE3 bacterium CG08_land_8_20_14_0_20_41_10]|uniref:YokE-like PH domain-containing protein n=1 Tax=candidate division WWE3 bacterium CG08_land_8_20_14_0_20_41_10 TaxID=1975085 RepID=A0A2H0XBD1_UNCKA|nr:MAG: hypothetical protein COT50_03180 [candidate division WWE3 bacterium CG08_land_8_20_14_0_20_41_10]